ncbi:protein-(glutamine-N5) methyltransferase, release factor-specific, partial [Pseudomonas sp. PDM10]|nr:protein-(glutamine-N5) methyltransferase, release factor-specific [Pseudomonas sp. PDM10]
MAETLASLVAESRDRLQAGGIENAALDVRRLISGLLDMSLSAVVS